MTWNVLVTARTFWMNGQAGRDLLERAGCRVVHSSQSGPLTEEALIAACQGMDAVIASTDPFTERVFLACPQLKVIARCGVGIDSVDLDAATRHGVLLTNTPGAMTDAVADYTFALLLSLARHIPAGLHCMREGGWIEYPGFELPGKTLGLVGFGMIGQAVARRAFGFSMRTIAYDPAFPWNDTSKERWGTEAVSLEDVFRQSDIVSIHAPNTAATRHLVNRERLAMMRPTAYLINTARGPLVDETALLDALEHGIIAGAATDVYEQEPLPADHPLRRCEKMLLTPHNAFNSVEAARRMNTLAAESIVQRIAGKLPRFSCNPAACDSIPCDSAGS